jgi:hypothetical protein
LYSTPSSVFDAVAAPPRRLHRDQLVEVEHHVQDHVHADEHHEADHQFFRKLTRMYRSRIFIVE